MFSANNSAIANYQRIGVESGVDAANPHKLILMLFEGVQEALAKAKMHMQHNEIEAKGIMISKAIMIIDHGLKASLDISAGGDMALKLQSLYEYMTNRLLTANIENNPEIINEVNGLLNEIYTAWQAIGDTNEAKTAPHTSAL